MDLIMGDPLKSSKKTVLAEVGDSLLLAKEWAVTADEKAEQEDNIFKSWNKGKKSIMVLRWMYNKMKWQLYFNPIGRHGP